MKLQSTNQRNSHLMIMLPYLFDLHIQSYIETTKKKIDTAPKTISPTLFKMRNSQNFLQIKLQHPLPLARKIERVEIITFHTIEINSMSKIFNMKAVQVGELLEMQ